jgi:hypothetical protein
MLALSVELPFKEIDGRSFDIVPLPAARQAIFDAGGLIAFGWQRLLQQRVKI